MSKLKSAIYAFSGDPITYGHINIIDKALQIFDTVIVAIGVNPDKKYTFTLKERLRFVKEIYKDSNKSVVIKSFDGLLTDFARFQGCKHIIRGIRNTIDYAYEQNLYIVNKRLYPDLETVFLFADPAFEHISSSTVKALQKNNGSIKEYVPMNIKVALEQKISNQFIVGITGEICSGKSYIAEKLINFNRSQKTDFQIHNIDLDKIAHNILESDTDPFLIPIRRKIYDTLFSDLSIDIDKWCFLDRKKIGQIIFNDAEKLAQYNTIIKYPVLLKLRKELLNKNGIILINTALLVEENLLDFVNNSVIIVHVTEQIKQQHAEIRGCPLELLNKISKFQLCYKDKASFIQKCITKDKYGWICSFDNSKDNADVSHLHMSLTKQRILGL